MSENYTVKEFTSKTVEIQDSTKPKNPYLPLKPLPVKKGLLYGVAVGAIPDQQIPIEGFITNKEDTYQITFDYEYPIGQEKEMQVGIKLILKNTNKALAQADPIHWCKPMTITIGRTSYRDFFNIRANIKFELQILHTYKNKNISLVDTDDSCIIGVNIFDLEVKKLSAKEVSELSRGLT